MATAAWIGAILDFEDKRTTAQRRRDKIDTFLSALLAILFTVVPWSIGVGTIAYKAGKSLWSFFGGAS